VSENEWHVVVDLDGIDKDRDVGPGSYAALLEDKTAVCVRWHSPSRVAAVGWNMSSR
jgi:hypothetical protein